MTALLTQGPEGRISRTPHLTRARSGAARMALATGAPIVPMAIFGTGGVRLRDWRPWRRPDIRIVLGPPEPVDPARTPEEISDVFMRTLASMLGQPYIPAPPAASAPRRVLSRGRTS